ncbi:class I SAM-dependent methyltransferase [Bacillus sp. AFS017336]|uniref:class I SAM-dependent methyltransferase n=1 Tax=Bacillus sp. AFS017336 TaxID=2033489 RepID=UPI000BF051FF|nr:class I SAM-dependent methyltransferase [Bacillus sp. AFS017336]PEL13606.1 SAM-dependent methyltransferase [Bacillus sp. AFS017336]
MTIDFHDAQNKMTYTSREADPSWLQLMKDNIDLNGKNVVDLGCGGGIYSIALTKLSVNQVTAVDFSEEMLKGAAENCKDYKNIKFSKGDAYDTKLPSSSYDVILERALVHHLDSLTKCFSEANRLLKKNGILIVQDRTPEDCLLPGDAIHLRGYFFDQYPKLKTKEIARRYDSKEMQSALESAGFHIKKEIKLWETRRIYNDLDSLKTDLFLRTGRSILHELTDDELTNLVNFIEDKLKHQTPIIEKDRWTIWIAKKGI